MQSQIASLTLFLLCLSGAPPVPPQDVQDQDKTKGSQGFILKAGEHDLIDVLERAAEFLGRNYLLPQADLGNPAQNRGAYRRGRW